jgi:hypothetical protein
MLDVKLATAIKYCKKKQRPIKATIYGYTDVFFSAKT